MTQKRFINFGTTADAAKTKAITQQMFAPGLLRADPPFMVAQDPDQIVISPHSVIFETGLVLIEDEPTTITISTGFSSQDFTIYYEHIDVDQIGGAAAILRVVNGLLQEVNNGVILGWVRYPGGSVAVDTGHIFPAFQAQIRAGREFREEIRTPSQGQIVATADNIVSDNPSIALGETIPAFPHQIILPGLPVSRRLEDTEEQQIRVFDRTLGVDMTRVSNNPEAGEFSVNTTTGTFSFNELDATKVVDIFDMTYGPTLIRTRDDGNTEGTEDLLFSFNVWDQPVRSLSVEWVEISDYTIDLVEVIDTGGNAADTQISKTEPSAPDGSLSRMVVRLLTGTFQGVSGQQFILRIRKTIGVNGEGLLLRARASAYDLPF